MANDNNGNGKYNWWKIIVSHLVVALLSIVVSGLMAIGQQTEKIHNLENSVNDIKADIRDIRTDVRTLAQRR